MQTSRKSESKQNRGTAYSVESSGKARRAGCSPAAAELLGIIREEKRRRAGAAVVPSVERLARLQGCSPATTRRRLRELASAGLLWTLYRGGRGQRPLYYVARPSEVPEGWRLQRGSGESYPVKFERVTAPTTLDLETPILETTIGAPAEAGAVAPSASASEAAPLPLAPSRGEGERDAPPLAARWIWAVWCRVWAQLHDGHRYERQERDGASAVTLARLWAGHEAGASGLAWTFARYIRSGAGADRGSPLWLVPHESPRRPPPTWNPATLRTNPRPVAATTIAASRSAVDAPTPVPLPESAARELARLYGGSWGR